MNTMKNELIAWFIISCILMVPILANHPISEITLESFSAIYGIVGYILVKKVVDAYFAKKR